MNKKTLMIIAIVLLLAGLAGTGNGIFWQSAISDAQAEWELHQKDASELLQKSSAAQAANAPDAHQLIEELEKANRYVKYAEERKNDAAANRNIYLGAGVPLLVLGIFLMMKARKKTES